MSPFDLQGHRGARGLKPENTLPAFEVALDLGVTSIETDVHLTKDGVPVLAHDPTFPFVPGESGVAWISNLTLTELRRFSPAFERDVRRWLTHEAAVKRRRAVGGTAPVNVDRRLKALGV